MEFICFPCKFAGDHLVCGKKKKHFSIKRYYPPVCNEQSCTEVLQQSAPLLAPKPHTCDLVLGLP